MDLAKNKEGMKTNIIEIKETAEDTQRSSLEGVSKLKMELKEMGSKQVVKMEKEITQLKQEINSFRTIQECGGKSKV